MKHTSKTIMRVLRWFFALYSLHFVIGYVAAVTLLGYHLFGHQTFNYLVALISAAHLIFEVVTQFTLAKRSLWTSTMVSWMFALLATTIVIEYTGVYRSPYALAVLGVTFLGGALGQYLPFGAAFLYFLGYMLVLAGVFTTDDGGPILGMFFNFLEGLVAVSSYFFWRKFYTLQETPELLKLSRMLNNSETQSNILLQSIADGVVVTDTKGAVTLINPAASLLCGWKSDEAKALDVSLVMKLNDQEGKPIDAEQYPFRVALQNKKSVNQTVQLVSKEAPRTSTISLVISPLITPQTNEIVGTIAVFRDVSEAIREEQQRADFISTASHEMRTPVAAIEGYLALALNGHVSQIDAKARSYLEKAHASTQHLGKLFQDLLTSAKAEDGRLVSYPIVVEMGAYLDALVEAFRFAAEKKGLLLDYALGASTPTDKDVVAGSKVIRPLYFIHADPDRLREVITNLFDNAVKYTSSGKITVGLTGNNDVVQFFISDTGPGIPAQDIPHLGQKFYRVDSSETRTIGGTGLGLFISRKIVELYKGRLWAESEVGKGSTFYINLPRLTTEKAAQLQQKEASQQANRSQPVTSLTTPVT